jgi:deoxyribodipyrimidine photolyase-related protein
MEITWVYPHQLFAKHPAVSKEREIWLIEEPLFFGNDPRWPAAMHQQKLMLHRASMKAYAAELGGDGPSGPLHRGFGETGASHANEVDPSRGSRG